MKKLSYLLTVGILACLFCACNSKEVTNLEQTGELAKLSVKFSGTKSIESRADANAIGEEATLKNATVLIFKGEFFETKEAFKPNETEAKDIVVTTGDKTIIVVANMDVPAVTTLTEFNKLLADLAEQGDTKGFTMVSPLIEYTIDPGKNELGYTDGDKVVMTRLVARVELKKLKSDLTEYLDGKYTLKDFTVFMANAREKSKLTGTASYGTGKYLYGCEAITLHLSTTFAPTTESIYDQDFLLAENVTPNDEGIVTDCRFYAFENKAPQAIQTRMIIKAKVQYDGADLQEPQLGQQIAAKNVDADGFTYFSIAINKKRANTKDEGADDKLIEKNNIYNLDVLLNQLGKNTPDAPDTEYAELDVKIQVANWKLIINQKVVW